MKKYLGFLGIYFIAIGLAKLVIYLLMKNREVKEDELWA